MPFHQPDEIRYYTFDSLDAEGLVHGILTRRGGVSPAPWSSLNLGGTVGDDLQCVQENRRRAFAALQCSPEASYDVWQVHGIQAVCAEAPRLPGQPHLQADAILTGVAGLTLFMRFADCVPVLLYDPRRKVVGLVHAGWKGTVLRTAAHAVQAMQARYQTNPQDLLAAIGPSIAPHHYQVGQEVIEQARAAFGERVNEVLRFRNGSEADSGVKFDLWAANRLVLEEAGVRHVETCEICTACNLEDWYSHRAEAGKTGRFGALLSLQQKRK
jgi:hypothetical protein